jgi:flagellar hook-associated protein 1 FlgK
MALSPTFGLAARALHAQSLVLHTTGHNLVNVDRPGYTRQQVELTAAGPLDLPGALVGGGVAVDGVRQVIDPLVEEQLLRARSDGADAGAARDAIARLEGFFNQLDGGGLQGTLDAFFASADDVALHPQGIAERQTFLARAADVALRFQDRAGELANLQREIDERLVDGVDRANGLLDDIARLNLEIFAQEVDGQSANDLRDLRREALGDLAKLVGITQFETDSQVTVVGPDGLSLVERGRVTHLALDDSTAPSLVGLDGRNLSRVGFNPNGGGFVPFTSVVGGELAGQLAVRDGDIPTVAASLDQLAEGLRASVNAILASGEDLDGNAGAALFGGTTAANISVLVSDPRQVAAAAAGTGPENNQNALALAGLPAIPLDGTDPTLGNADLGGATLIGFVAGTVGSVGLLAEAANDRADAAEALTTELENERAAISGVSTDEELVTLLGAQRAFQAAATLVNVTTSTIDAVLAMVQ